MRGLTRIGLGLLSVALVLGAFSGPAAEAADVPGTVTLHGVVAPPAVTEPITLWVGFYPIKRTITGHPELGPVTALTVPYDPAFQSRPAEFTVELQAETEYQVNIEILDIATGARDERNTYMFSDPAMVGDYPEKIVSLVAGEGRFSIDLVWHERDVDKANFVQVYPAGQGGQYDLSLYFNPDVVRLTKAL